MKTRNVISRKDTVKAIAYNNDNVMCIVYDSGFNSVNEVINELKRRSSGWLKPITIVYIINYDRGTSGRYNSNGRRID
mgnify:CR=1 FL=1|jgi:hypothetical protein